jgi:glycogen debranching enzyme
MQASSDRRLFEDGFARAVELLYQCVSPDGFLASPTKTTNYRRVWARDGVIIGLSALLTEEPDLISTTRHTLETLARYQGSHGEIPSNVDTTGDRISYGGMAGRVDADLWFIIGCGEYWKATGDDAFLECVIPAMEKARFLLGAWEFNNRGLLYIPETGDWADEYIHNGYVLYDQLLYLQALRTCGAVRRHFYGAQDHTLQEKANRLKHLIRDNFWFIKSEAVLEDVYHEILYRKGRQAADKNARNYWLPFFTPHGYGYRFDSFANILASLLGVSNEERTRIVDEFIRTEIMSEGIQLMPAFHPVIRPVDDDWEELHMTFSYTFKNKPYEYHNGGLWPMITGFYVADLARRGQTADARECLRKIHESNALVMENEPWSFPEYIHGKKMTAEGTKHQGWSAAGAIIGHCAIQGQPTFRIGDDSA